TSTNANDGSLWIKAGKHFFNALQHKDFLDTHYSSRFGVSVMWLYGLAKAIWLITSFSIEQILATIVFLLSVTGIVIFVKRLKKLDSQPIPSFTILTYLLLAPYIVSSPLATTWLDKILTISVTLCVVFWTEYLFRNKSTSLILLSGLTLGVAFLTKPAGIILVPILLLMTGYIIWKDHSVKTIIPLLYVFIIGASTFIFCYPAMWIDPLGVLFSRIDSPEAHLDLTVPFLTNNSFVPYLGNIVEGVFADFLLTVGTIMILVDFVVALKNKAFKKFITPLTFISIAGTCFVAISFILALFLVDKQYGNVISPRYIAPAIPLVAIYPLIKLRNNKIILSLAFLIQIYRLPVIIISLWYLSYLIFGNVIYLPYW
ncbi:hypothetical protein CO179_01985, partial [candidate division WWE3 bacterium CG_4_9_14_3_um_filter_39_7]